MPSCNRAIHSVTVIEMSDWARRVRRGSSRCFIQIFSLARNATGKHRSKQGVLIRNLKWTVDLSASMTVCKQTGSTSASSASACEVLIHQARVQKTVTRRCKIMHAQENQQAPARSRPSATPEHPYSAAPATTARTLSLAAVRCS